MIVGLLDLYCMRESNEGTSVSGGEVLSEKRVEKGWRGMKGDDVAKLKTRRFG